MCVGSRYRPSSPARAPNLSTLLKYRWAAEAVDGDRPLALPDGGCDPVHAGDLRDLSEPQERDHHADVDRVDAACGQHQLRRVLGLSERSRRPGLRDVRADGCGGRSGNWPRHSRRLLPQSRHYPGRGHQHDERLMPLAVAVVFLPLLAAVIAGFFGRALGNRGSQLITCGALLLSAVLAVLLFRDILSAEEARVIPLASWIIAGGVDVSWSLRLDTLSGVMIVVVTVVSSMVHVYSIGYMAHDPSIPRFMAYLSLFTFFMLALVTADNFVQLFFGWEGVGLMSYLLVGFWYDRPSANAAAIKAFLVNRVGDFGFSLGIYAIFVIFGTLDFSAVFGAAPKVVGTTMEFLGWQGDSLTLACILLFTDAMEGPTPVSALIHAATMVTAGVFMVARLSPLFEYAPTALAVVGIIGAT